MKKSSCEKNSPGEKNHSGRLRVYVADDHPSIRSALRHALEGTMDMAVCGTSASKKEALEEIEALKPDVAVIDIALQDGHGLDLIEKVQKGRLAPKTIVYSMYDETVYAERAIKAGASGYLEKTEPTGRLIEAIRHVSEGRFYLSRRMYSRVLDGGDLATEPAFPVDQLTEREKEVFQLIGEGLEIEKIAGRLDINRKTAETHRRRAKEKLGVETVHELVQHAVQWVLRTNGAHEKPQREQKD